MAKRAAVTFKSLGFQSLSESIHIYTPAAAAENETVSSTDKDEQAQADSPGLIVICTWAFAQQRHIVKYLAWYLQLYPSSPILVLQSDSAGLLWKPNACPGGPGDTQGALRALSAGFGGAGAGANSTAITRLVGQSLAYLAVGSTILMRATGICQPAVEKAWDRLKDPQRVPALLNAHVARTYVFSDADQVISAEDVRLHARLSIQALEEYAGGGGGVSNKVIRFREFSGTAHVNHMPSNSERYWGIVKETWAASASLSLALSS
ncbi:hypothetical protein DV735_g8, partial [Chaetothyriales sp. CBS 134920]